MRPFRLARGAVCVAATFPVLIAACAGHTSPPSRNGDIEPPTAVATPSSTLSALMSSSVVPATARSLPNDLLIGVKLDQPLTTARPEGFAFSTKVVEPIRAKDGTVAVPEGTTIRGVITAVRPGGGAKTPVICVNLDFIEWNGRAYGIVSSVKNVLVSDRPARILPPDSLAVFSANTPGFPVKGAAIVLSPAAAGEAAELPAGTVLVVQLDSALSIGR